MRVVLICLLVIFVALGVYAYTHDPADSLKLLNDAKTLAINLSPVKISSETAAPSPAAPAPPAQPIVAAPAPAAPSAPAAPAPMASPPIKSWAPPAVTPAQPNWTWTTLDGKSYQNVVVTEIKPDTVAITHSMGVAHIDINMLPPDIQKQLNYDPDAAAAARTEKAREEAHPYYTMASMTEAQSVAQQMHWPLAWVSSLKEYITSPNPAQGDETALTLLALNFLKDKSIIIFINASNEMGQTPPIVHHQFSAFDDGVLPGGANYLIPKVVFSTPDASKIFGRVSFTQMKASGTFAISEVLDSIPKDSDNPSSSEPATNVPASSSSSPAPVAPPPPTTPPPPSTPSTNSPAT